MKRTKIAALILDKLHQEKDQLQKQFNNSKDKIGFFYLDDLLPSSLATKIYDKFPTANNSQLKKSLKEHKYVAYQMDKYDSLLEEAIYAFQDQKIVTAIADICNFKEIFPDEYLYAGGLSLMGKDNFLNPHLDNSHDRNREQWRVLNLLYYVTPNWKLENGGNLELWPNGLKSDPITIESKFNRLAVMVTHSSSWHSVTKVKVNEFRCCVSNYYFSKNPIFETDTFHVTSFRGRPNQKTRDIYLQIDNKLRMSIRKIFKKGIRKNPHQYKK